MEFSLFIICTCTLSLRFFCDLYSLSASGVLHMMYFIWWILLYVCLSLPQTMVSLVTTKFGRGGGGHAHSYLSSQIWFALHFSLPHSPETKCKHKLIYWVKTCFDTWLCRSRGGFALRVGLGWKLIERED